LSFRAAHRLVSAAVRAAGKEYAPKRLIAEIQRLAPRIVGQRLKPRRAEWLRTLDPKHFVQVRKIVGGPAPEAVGEQIARADEEARGLCTWLEEKRAQLARYPQLIHEATVALGAARPERGHSLSKPLWGSPHP
jgi:argininosuccinate lyase